MNCKPGDLAIVLRGLEPNSPHAGKIVEVISAARHNTKFGAMWNVRFSTPIISRAVTVRGVDLGQEGFRSELHCPDAWLKPLPEIGNDEVDETLQLVGAPSKEGVTA